MMRFGVLTLSVCGFLVAAILTRTHPGPPLLAQRPIEPACTSGQIASEALFRTATNLCESIDRFSLMGNWAIDRRVFGIATFAREFQVSTNNSIHHFDIRDGVGIVESGVTHSASFVDAWEEDGILYVADDANGLGVLSSVDEDSTLRVLSYTELPNIEYARCVYAKRGYVYVGTEFGDLYTFNVDSPSEPRLVSESHDGAGRFYWLAGIDTHLFYGSLFGTIHVYDISDSGEPVWSSVLGLDSQLTTMVVSGSVLVVGSRDGLVTSYIVDERSQLVEVGSSQAPAPVVGVSVNNHDVAVVSAWGKRGWLEVMTSCGLGCLRSNGISRLEFEPTLVAFLGRYILVAEGESETTLHAFEFPFSEGRQLFLPLISE